MTKSLIREQVINLRKQGKSYSEIRKLIKVSKSSLSLWLKNISLTDRQKSELLNKKYLAIERYRESMQLKREKRLNEYYEAQLYRWIPLTNREKLIAGLFLYWGEGNKASSNRLDISNSDPSVIKFATYWMNKCLLISLNDLHFRLHLYSDMDINQEIHYWSKILGVGVDRFAKPYIKSSLRKDIDQKGFGHGTCNVSAYKTVLKENVMMAIRAISNNYARASDLI